MQQVAAAIAVTDTDPKPGKHWENYFRRSAKLPQYLLLGSIKLLSKIGFPNSRPQDKEMDTGS